MPAYVATLLDVHDQGRLREYLQGAGPSLVKHDGATVLRGRIVDVVEGS